jgi:hypothetical protein
MYVAPFKRNDATLSTLPIWVVAFPDPGIVENFVDNARRTRSKPAGPSTKARGAGPSRFADLPN